VVWLSPIGGLLVADGGLSDGLRMRNSNLKKDLQNLKIKIIFQI
jgi:hypothetical protein